LLRAIILAVHGAGAGIIDELLDALLQPPTVLEVSPINVATTRSSERMCLHAYRIGRQR
jgi:hypothetical protein